MVPNNLPLYILILLFLAVALWLYLLPWLIAESRRHPHVTTIALVNVLLGWSFAGWLVALIWALSEQGRKLPEHVARRQYECSTCETPLGRGEHYCPGCGGEIERRQYARIG